CESMAMYCKSMLNFLYLLIISFRVQGFYKVIWNVASRPCVNDGINIPLSKFEIAHNEGQHFFGDAVVVFYQSKFALYPYYENNDPNRPINGGLPQNISLQAHLDAVAQQIQNDIPNPNFDGIAVIDLEAWRPLYKMNWDEKQVYKDQSVQLVLQNDPSLSTEQAEVLAEEQFDQAARNFFVETLRVARELRPRGHWGYYEYPFCNADAGDRPDDYSCTTTAQEYNDQLGPIYDASTALFPSIYLYGDKTTEQSFRFVQAVLTETNRIANQQGRRLKFFPYTKIEYDSDANPTWFYNESDLCNTVKQPADLGASGIVVWGTSKNMKDRCNGVANYIDTQFGPFLLNIRRNLEQCRREICSGNGNCQLQQPSTE
uniref:Hyaluronidase n=1 Tax=Haemonchus contortus TaxID=6289 RepID=A0A7I4Y7E6_HAECO